jgi:hypothetical protein
VRAEHLAAAGGGQGSGETVKYGAGGLVHVAA